MCTGGVTVPLGILTSPTFYRYMFNKQNTVEFMKLQQPQTQLFGSYKGRFLFNDTLNTFYLRLYGVGHMVNDHSESERGNLPPPHGLLFPISSKGSLICTIPDRIAHTTAFVTLVMEHRLELEIAQWAHQEGSILQSIVPWANNFTMELGSYKCLTFFKSGFRPNVLVLENVLLLPFFVYRPTWAATVSFSKVVYIMIYTVNVMNIQHNSPWGCKNSVFLR